MKTLFFSLTLMIASVTSFAADNCSYCGEMEKLKAGFAKVKPDAMNNATIDRQNDLVDKSLALIQKVLKEKKDFPVADMRRVIPFLGIVVTYDYQNLVADELLDQLHPHADRFFQEVTRMEKERAITSERADEIRIAIGTAEAVAEDGTDPQAPKK